MKIRNLNIFSLLNIFLKIGILVIFIFGFLKLFISIPNNLFLRFIFIITYLWFTIGVNVNFIMPLIEILNKNAKNIRN